MLSIAHISDLHFGEPLIAEAAASLAERLADLAPDIIIVSGDLTQRAKIAEFRQAREFLRRLPAVPTVLVPGNHDVPLYRIWERLFYPHRNYRRYISKHLDSVLRRDDAVIVGLNSSAPYRAISNGRLRPEQLNYCAAAFADAPPSAARMVVLHHHIVPAPTFGGGELIAGAKQILEAFTEMRVDLVFTGHLHRAYVGNSLDVYAGDDRDHGVLIIQCGTSTSRRGRGMEREKNSFNWLRLTDQGIEVNHYMFFADQHRFEPISRHAFAWPEQRFLKEPGRRPITDRDNGA